MAQIITSQFNVATVEKGENAIYLDLSNDNDSILYVNGAAKNTCVTTITLYDGAKDVTAQAVVTHTATGCTVTKSGRTYTVTAITGDNVKGTVLISAAYNGQNYSNTFTITKLVDKDRYELICSPNSVTVNTTTGAKSASAIKVEIYKTPYTTGIRAKLNTLDGGHSLKYYVNNGVSPTAISFSGGSGSFNVDANNSSYRVVLASGDVELDSETIPINKSENGVDGENAVRIDISNEMDMIPTTTARLISAARTVETIVRLFDGASEVNISTATLSPAGGPASTIATFNQTASGKGKKLSWAFIAGQTMAEAYEIVISYTYNSVSYSATFTVCASKGEAVWQLQPSMSAIPFQRNSDNTLTPASQNVGLTLLKIDGGSTATYTQVQTGLTVRYSTSSMPSSATAGTGWSSGNISVPNTATNLYIAMFNSSGTLLDRETVPVIKDGENGKSITKKSESYRYATNNTGVRPAASSSDWKTTKPTLQKGYWLYVEITITWSDNSTTVLYTEERNPNDGVAGMDIIVDGSTEIKYYVGDSNTTHPAETSSDWKDISQVVQTQGKWLWSKATTYYRKSSSAEGSHDGGKSVNYNVSYIAKDGTNGKDGKDGMNGRGISGTNIYYKAASSKPSTPSGAPSSSGWVDDGNTLITEANASNHLYESTCTSYTDGTYSWTAPIDDGLISDMATTSEEFALADSATTAPTSGWSASVTPSAGKWIWSRTKLTFKSGNPKYVNTQCVGYCGTNGANGRSLTGVTEYYKATNSDAEMPVPTSDTGWSTNPNVSDWGANAKYLWNYEKLTYSSGTTVERTKPQIVAIWTKDGKGIDSIVNYYKITQTSTPPTRPSVDGGEGWDDTPTAPGQGEYLWNYEKVTYTDGTVYRSEVELTTYVGKDGNGIVSITNKFALSAQGTTASETTAPTIVGSWSTTEPTPTDDYPYVWRREKTVYTDTTKNTTKYFLVAAKGKDGQRGHTGRWYEYYGDVTSTSAVISNTDDHGWFIKKGDYFYMLIAESGIGISTTTAPSDASSNENWDYMGGDRKYYIGEAFFGAYAHLGSFIINGDWMISQYGYLYVSASDVRTVNTRDQKYGGNLCYTYFKPADPTCTGSGSYPKFAPSWAVDGLQGKQYHNGRSGGYASYVSLDDDGFTVKWGGEGIKVGPDGLQRLRKYTAYNEEWLPMFNKRNILVDGGYASVNLPSSVDYFLNTNKTHTEGNRRSIYLPDTSELPNGAIVTVRGVEGAWGVVKPKYSNTERISMGDIDDRLEIGMESADCVEFVLAKKSSSGLSYETWLCNYYDRDY